MSLREYIADQERRTRAAEGSVLMLASRLGKILAALVCLGPMSAWAQITPLQKIFAERFNSLLASYRDCVSAASDNDFWKKDQFEMAVEQAFLACRTEEDALRLLMRSAAPQISTNSDEIILGEKASMKSRLVPR